MFFTLISVTVCDLVLIRIDNTANLNLAIVIVLSLNLETLANQNLCKKSKGSY